MFNRFFRRERSSNRAITEALYLQIVAAARQPIFYSDWGVSDTPLGRYEMMSLHMVLALRRMRTAELREIAQEVTDHFFLEVDHSLRELGVGDVGVPKRMKRLAKMHFGRAAAYNEALDAADIGMLERALGRNIWPNVETQVCSSALAGYGMRADQRLAQQTVEEISSGKLAFPAAASEV